MLSRQLLLLKTIGVAFILADVAFLVLRWGSCGGSEVNSFQARNLLRSSLQTDLGRRREHRTVWHNRSQVTVFSPSGRKSCSHAVLQTCSSHTHICLEGSSASHRPSTHSHLRTQMHDSGTHICLWELLGSAVLHRAATHRLTFVSRIT